MDTKATGSGNQTLYISASRTPEFFTAAQAVSDYLNGLPLTGEQNNKLVELMVAHVQAAERSGFYAGCLFNAGGVKEEAGSVLS